MFLTLFFAAAVFAQVDLPHAGTYPATHVINNVVAASKTRAYDDSFKLGVLADYEPIVWSLREEMLSIVELFIATRQTHAGLFQELRTSSEFLMAHTSKALGITDSLFGRPVETWVDTNFSCDKPYAPAVYAGVLGEPIAWFSLFALSNPRLCDEACRASALELRAFLERVLGEFAGMYDPSGFYRWYGNFGPLSNCKKFTDNASPSAPLPNNWSLSLALLRQVLWMSYKQPGVGRNDALAQTHLTAVLQMARFFKTQLVYVNAYEGYTWLYVPNGRPEDVSHAVTEVQFVHRLVSLGPSGVFSTTDTLRLTNTLLRFVAGDPNRIWTHVDRAYGKQSDDQGFRQGLVKWAPLSTYSDAVWSVCAYLNYVRGGGSTYGTALLERYKPTSYELAEYTPPNLGSVFFPWRLLVPSGSSYLVRTTKDNLQLIDNVHVSACIQINFGKSIETLTVIAQHVDIDLGVGDDEHGIQGAGLGVFRRINNAWKIVYEANGINLAARPKSTSTTLTYKITQPTPYFLVCRGGSGAGANNVLVSFVHGGSRTLATSFPPLTAAPTTRAPTTVTPITLPPTLPMSTTTAQTGQETSSQNLLAPTTAQGELATGNGEATTVNGEATTIDGEATSRDQPIVSNSNGVEQVSGASTTSATMSLAVVVIVTKFLF